MNTLNSTLNHSFVTTISEASELISEISKAQLLGLDFKRDSQHSSIERLVKELADLTASCDHLLYQLINKNDQNIVLSEVYRERLERKSEILEMENLLIKNELYPVRKEEYIRVVQEYRLYREYGKNYPLTSFMMDVHPYLTDVNEIIDGLFSNYFSPLVNCEERTFTPFASAEWKIDVRKYFKLDTDVSLYAEAVIKLLTIIEKHVETTVYKTALKELMDFYLRTNKLYLLDEALSMNNKILKVSVRWGTGTNTVEYTYNSETLVL